MRVRQGKHAICLFCVLAVIIPIFTTGCANIPAGQEVNAGAVSAADSRAPGLPEAREPLSRETRLRVQENYGQLPLYFIENQGQVDERVKYYEQGRGHSVYFTQDGVAFSFHKGDAKGAQETKTNNDPAPSRDDAERRAANVSLEFLGMRKDATLVAEEVQECKVNYFVENDSAKWKANVPTYKSVLYREVYPGIDIRFYGNNRRLEYDIIVKPGADPSQVAFVYSGIKGMTVSEAGDLSIDVGADESLAHKKPVVYQIIDGKRGELEGRFVLGQNVSPDSSSVKQEKTALAKYSFGFEVGRYDSSYPLFIDPVLVYSTYLGGSDREYDTAIAVDGSGNAYVTGHTYSSDFPTKNSIYPNLRGSSDAFVTKINTSGTELVYSTYLGGSEWEYDTAIAVDGSGNAYVTGHTCSSDFPTKNSIYPNLRGSSDAFVTKINASGTELVYSTYLGGSEWEYDTAIAVDGSGNAYVTGRTYSSDFPAKNPIYPNLWGHKDAFVTKINASGTELVYSTYLGGSEGDGGRAIAVDGSGNAYVTGSTSSPDFPTKNPIYPNLWGDKNAFVTKINASGTELVYSTYLGGSEWDLDRAIATAIAVDGSGNAYVTGSTSSPDFPTKNPIYPNLRGYDDAFVTKINASGTELVYSTYLGGSEWESDTALAVDGSGNAYVTGITGSLDFPTKNPTIPLGGSAFVTKINASGTELVYSTYLGGSEGGSYTAIAVDGSGNAYVTGRTYSSDFPTKNPIYPNLWGDSDAFVTKISPFYPTIDQTPMSGPPGTTFVQWGTGFTPNSTVTLHFRNQLGEALTPIQNPTDGQGGFSITYQAPPDKPAGTHTWWAVDDTTGNTSKTIGYLITGPIGTQTNLNTAPPPAYIPVAVKDDIFGTLTRPFPWDPDKESFVIVHGWNPTGETGLPNWVTLMGSAIHSDPKSQAPGANVFYWNWQDKARSKETSMPEFGPGSEPVDLIQWILSVPFDNVKNSGNKLADALQLGISSGYNKNIHLIGHSLGTGVITYATKRALNDKYNYSYKNNIDHLVFLDSPWLFDRPADNFLKTIENQVFLENYCSALGKLTGYWESDTNVYLRKSVIFGLDNPHAYSHEWYRSSVTNFSEKSILGDITTPSQTLPYGFYWWDADKRANVSSAYLQFGLQQYNLQALPIEELASEILDAAEYYTGDLAAKTWQKLAEQADRTKKKITLLAVNTYNKATDLAEYFVDESNHAVHQAIPCPGIACGVLRLEHQSDAVVSTTITIPSDANALSFGYEFQYADQDSALELIIEDLSVFHAFSQDEISNGYQMAPWIDVSKLAGKTVTVTFRISNPTEGSEGACIIDDLIFAKIEEIDADQDLIPNVTEDISQCLNSSDADSDDDGIADGVEDSNQNGIVDPGETNPCSPDTDNDGIQDGTEKGVNEPVPDPDGAGQLLGTDTNKFQPDMDANTYTDPLNPDTDGDGIKDGDEDKNFNGRVDSGETDPTLYTPPERGKALPWIPLLLVE